MEKGIHRDSEQAAAGDEDTIAPLLKNTMTPPDAIALAGPEGRVARTSRNSDGEGDTSSSASSNKGSDDLPVGASATSVCEGGIHRGSSQALTSADTARCISAPSSIGSQKKLPLQRQANSLMKWLLPVSILMICMTVGPVVQLLFFQGEPHGHLLIDLLAYMPAWLIAVAFGISLLTSGTTYIYHYCRFSGWQEIPELPSENSGHRPLTHVVVVCSYKEPTEVLLRTFESIASQRGLRSQPIAVLAAEDRDQTRHASFAEIQRTCNGRLAHSWMTSHVLLEGEPAGKSSNENYAVRDVYSRLVGEMGLNPFEVMVTIADADSIFSSGYLAHVESAFFNESDGRRRIYKGPLNVYRNLMEANLLIQCMELARCHSDMFHPVFSVPYPYSNYSLSLGFAEEIGFWTADVMPEDIHTANKAMVNGFGAKATVTIPAVICNDLVPSVRERYVQAKRHQWGSVTEIAWTLTLLKDTKIRFAAWSAVWTSECARMGSWCGAVGTAAQLLVQMLVFIVLLEQRKVLPPNAALAFGLLGMGAAVQWLWFWIGELTYWNTIMREFPAERPSVFRWILLMAFMPFASMLNNILFFIIPTFHALFHATFISHDLAYVTAPKGDSARQPEPPV